MNIVNFFKKNFSEIRSTCLVFIIGFIFLFGLFWYQASNYNYQDFYRICKSESNVWETAFTRCMAAFYTQSDQSKILLPIIEVTLAILVLVFVINLIIKFIPEKK